MTSLANRRRRGRCARHAQDVEIDERLAPDTIVPHAEVVVQGGVGDPTATLEDLARLMLALRATRATGPVSHALLLVNPGTDCDNARLRRPLRAGRLFAGVGEMATD
jgi:hypothetical protein